MCCICLGLPQNIRNMPHLNGVDMLKKYFYNNGANSRALIG